MEDKKTEEEKKEEKEDKKEEDKKVEDKKEDTKKEDKKEGENDSNKLELSEKQQKMIMEQLKKLQLSQKYDKEEIKDEYKFWSTQPVPQFNKECDVKFGEIWKDHKIEDLEKEPLALPEGYEWKDVLEWLISVLLDKR